MYFFLAFFISALLSCQGLVQAASLTINVQDSQGAPLADAVLYVVDLLPSGNKPPFLPSQPVEIEQRNRTFIPRVTVVQAGTPIFFPNHDNVLHHVYSFSSAKKFELKLYSGRPATPLNFDKPGTVILGCNIHDKMIAYVQVVDTPFFAKSDAKGQATILHLPVGKHSLKAWHYKLNSEEPALHQVVVAETGNTNISVMISPNAATDSNTGK